MGRCRTTIRESGTLFLSVFIRVHPWFQAFPLLVVLNHREYVDAGQLSPSV